LRSDGSSSVFLEKMIKKRRREKKKIKRRRATKNYHIGPGEKIPLI